MCFACVAEKLLISIAVLLSLAFAPSAARPAEMPFVRANYAAFSGAFAPLWIAADKNLFAKYGLNVDLRYIAPATATQALISRNLDIINPGGEIVEAGLNGESVVYIAGILNRAVMSIYAKPEIRSLADLKGKVLAVTVPGATTDFAARVLNFGVRGLDCQTRSPVANWLMLFPDSAETSLIFFGIGFMSAPPRIRSHCLSFCFNWTRYHSPASFLPWSLK